MIEVATLVTRSHLARACVLAETLRESEPRARLSVLVVDGEAPADLPFDVVCVEDLALGAGEWQRRATLLDRPGFAMSLKPALLRWLLGKGHRAVVYLDSDVAVHGTLGEASRLAETHAAVLTPHLLTPADGDVELERLVLLAGVYNLGFVAVGPRSARLLDWWDQRVARTSRIAPAEGLYHDQRWADLMPAMFDCHVLRDPGYNVAHWNLLARQVERSERGYVVDGHPLRFVHFSGFDPDRPFLATRNQGEAPRLRLSVRPELADLFGDYARRLHAHGDREWRNVPYGFGLLPDGTPLDDRMRELYRDALSLHESGATDEPPNPFSHGDAFLDWLNAPAGAYPGTPVSRYLLGLWLGSSELQERFPDVRWSAANAYLDWVGSHACDLRVPGALVKLPRRSRRLAPACARGVNIVRADPPHGQVTFVAERLAAALARAGVDHEVLPIEWLPGEPGGQLARTPRFDVNLVCVDADRSRVAAWNLGPCFFERPTVGYLSWHLRAFPSEAEEAFPWFDEVWVPSTAVERALAPATARALRVCTPRAHAAVLEDRAGGGRDALAVVGGREPWLGSNPRAAIEAHRRAVASGAAGLLTVATAEGALTVAEQEELWHAGSRVSGVRVLDIPSTPTAVQDVLSAHGCLLAPYRTAGLESLVLDGVMLGIPAIVSAIPGLVSESTPGVTWLGPADTGSDRDPSESILWPEPDIDAAAEALRRHRLGVQAAPPCSTLDGLGTLDGELVTWIEQMRSRGRTR